MINPLNNSSSSYLQSTLGNQMSSQSTNSSNQPADKGQLAAFSQLFSDEVSAQSPAQSGAQSVDPLSIGQ